MAVILWKAKTTYVPVPKIACTSLKTMFFEYENGHDFVPFTANGRSWHIHNFYPDRRFADLPREKVADHARYTLVRDPIKRFLSGYSNRVVSLKELSRAVAGERLNEHGLQPDPDIATFLDRLEDYCAVSDSIRHHTMPMVHFIGRNPEFYTRIFALERLDEFLAVVGERLGKTLSAPRLQTGGPKLDSSILTGPQLAKLKARYEVDYDLYGDWL